MATVSVKVLGVKETRDFLKRASKEKRKNLSEAIGKQAGKLAEEIRRSMMGMRSLDKSWVTGNLLKSVQSDKVDDLTYSVGTNVVYAPWVEYGTRGGRKVWHGKPHFRKTLAEEKPKIIQAVQQSIK